MHFCYARREISFMSKRGSVKPSHQTHKYRVCSVAVSVTVRVCLNSIVSDINLKLTHARMPQCNQLRG